MTFIQESLAVSAPCLLKTSSRISFQLFYGWPRFHVNFDSELAFPFAWPLCQVQLAGLQPASAQSTMQSTPPCAHTPCFLTESGCPSHRISFLLACSFENILNFKRVSAQPPLPCTTKHAANHCHQADGQQLIRLYKYKNKYVQKCVWLLVKYVCIFCAYWQLLLKLLHNLAHAQNL